MFKNYIYQVYFWVGVNVIGLPSIIEHDTFKTEIVSLN